MRTRTVRWHLILFFALTLAGILLTTAAQAAGRLKVLKQGLAAGIGTVENITGSTINCGASCLQDFSGSAVVRLRAVAPMGSVFVGWRGDCPSSVITMFNECEVTMTTDRSIRAEFRLDPDVPQLPAPTLLSPLTPEIIRDHFMMYGSRITTPAHFVRALPDEFKAGWLLMTRSESLQTGTARFPRILMPSADMKTVFTVALDAHPAYPGAHENAIEYMQWDKDQKNFRFHEIVVAHIDAVSESQPVGPPREIFPAREQGVTFDEPRCTRCHSTRNVPNLVATDRGTTGTPPGSVLAKNKPNWDAYDSWGGLMPFNRDRIYQGSLEATAFRKIFNPWTWQSTPDARAVIEQLALQPMGVPAADVITRVNGGGTADGTIRFPFDGMLTIPPEPAPIGEVGVPNENITYNFDGTAVAAGTGTNVVRSGDRVTLHAVNTPTSEEGRGVQFFDLLGGLDGELNQTRIGDELANHRFATGNIPLDARPIALAITKRCITATAAGVLTVSGSTPLSVDLAFFTARNDGRTLAQLIADTRLRAESLPRRKADIQKINLDRDGDFYLMDPITAPQIDLISEYGIDSAFGTAIGVDRMRREIFRRRIDVGNPDQTVMAGKYVDREIHAVNSPRIGLFRYFLEPLGVSVDKWSMSVRGRSRTYTFADVLTSGGGGIDTYTAPIQRELEQSLIAHPYGTLAAPFNCGDVVAAVNSSLAPLTPSTALPTFTDIQRILNKNCIECHGGLDYPPFARSNLATSLDFSEEESPTTGSKLSRSFGFTSPRANRILTLVTRTSEDCKESSIGMMPCGGPAISQADVHTIRRWIPGSSIFTEGDPHLRTIDGTSYDFQSAGEFTLLEDEGMELQVRQTPVQTDTPLGPDNHTGLSSCPSINTAVAVRIGEHRITYQPNLSGKPDPDGLQLRVDGKLQEKLGERGILLASGGRILATTAQGGIQIQSQDGTDIVVTPGWWDHYQLWYLNVDVRRARATFGVAGQIAPGNWLPALAGGGNFGPRPSDLAKRYAQLYVKFADDWRVTNTGSLFDYASGTSTATFTLKGWPEHQPKSCKLPKGWDPGIEPPKPIDPDFAKELCSAIKDEQRRRNCATDVATTGDPGFAKTFAAHLAIQANLVPKPPALGGPEERETGLGDTVGFKWKPTSDKDGGKLTQLHCVWPAREKLTFAMCTPLSGQATDYVVSGLAKSESYYWKIVADDGQGGTVESETRLFKTK
jgi:mono/diheme cytochrome c family protein